VQDVRLKGTFGVIPWSLTVPGNGMALLFKIENMEIDRAFPFII
jgi:hypothetical protein